MKRSRFNEEQIIAILKEQESGLGTADLCRKHGISSATFYKWKAKYGGLDVSDARRLKTLEDENARLKKLLAEAMLDNAILKDNLNQKASGKPGAVQFDCSHVSLIHDFLFAQTDRMLHVCNAPSPAATSAIPIAEMIVTRLTGVSPSATR